MRILHVTQHLGGGLGTVILDWLAFRGDGHVIACLDYANEKAIRLCKENRISLIANISQSEKRYNDLMLLIAQADIVLFHWYNHPYLQTFLCHELPPCRLIFWCHKKYGVTPEERRYPDLFINVSPIQESKSYILSTGNMRRFLNVKPKVHDGFNVGYVGTVDYKKMHSHFKQICEAVEVKDIHFTIIGENKTKYKSDNRFDFIGHVNDVTPYLSYMDIFGYLLSSDHYGTCEQVLGEAMCAGVVPVALNNEAERSIIKSGWNGVLAENTDEYIQYIEMLSQQPDIRKKLSVNARSDARQRYSIERMTVQWEIIFRELIKQPKHADRLL